MSLQIQNSREVIDPGKFKFKVLVFGLSGTGKTSWAATAPDPGFAACETGQGSGLLSIAQQGVDFVTPGNLGELEAFTNGAVFKNKETLVVDSASYMVKSFIKDAALSIPRSGGNSQKRAQGVPELDDYGVMSEITRRLIAKLLEKDKHLVVTATEKDITLDDGVPMYVPDLPGAMALTCVAMFDFVFRLRTRQGFRDRKDPNSRYVERYFTTSPDGKQTLAKCRSNEKGIPLLPPEVVWDLSAGEGSFPWMLQRIKDGYAIKETKNQAPQQAPVVGA